MSLTWDVSESTRLTDYDKTDEGFLFTRALTFHTMSIGQWQLTDENASEWYARIAFLERDLSETLIMASSNDAKIDPDRIVGKGDKRPAGLALIPNDVWRHVGLRTNSGYDTPRREWIRQVVARHNDYAKRWGTDERPIKQWTYAEVREKLAEYADVYLAYADGQVES